MSENCPECGVRLNWSIPTYHEDHCRSGELHESDFLRQRVRNLEADLKELREIVRRGGKP